MDLTHDDLALRRWQYPAARAFVGSQVTLAPLDLAADAAELYHAGHADTTARALWQYLPVGPFADRAAFDTWLAQVPGQAGEIPFVVHSHVHNRRAGMIRVMNIEPAHGCAELGWIWYAPFIQRTLATTESHFLLLCHVFDELGYRRVEWKCNNANERSKAAALRMGFQYEGMFRQHRVIKGQNRDSAWFALLDSDWPARRANFVRVLAGEASSLAALNAELRIEMND